MIKIYPPEDYFDFETGNKHGTLLYASWKIKPSILDWMKDNCRSSWCIASDADFTWSIYNNWMNEVIDTILNQIEIPNQPYYWPFSICKPHILFDLLQDAIVFKLRF